MPSLSITPDNTPLVPEAEIEEIKGNFDEQQEEQAKLVESLIREALIRQRRALGQEERQEERAETQIESTQLQQDVAEKAAEIVEVLATKLEELGVEKETIEAAIEVQIESIIAEIVAAENKEPVRDRMAELLTVLSAAEIDMMIQNGFDPAMYDANTVLAGFEEARAKVEEIEKAANTEEVAEEKGDIDPTQAVEGAEAPEDITPPTVDGQITAETDAVPDLVKAASLNPEVTGLEVETKTAEPKEVAATVVPEGADREVEGQGEEKRTAMTQGQ